MDGSELPGAFRGGISTKNLIRRVTSDDFGWILDIARKAYSGFSEENGYTFFQIAICHPDFIVLRGEKSIGVACVEVPSLLPHLNIGKLVLLFGTEKSGWEPYQILKTMIEWARSKGASEFNMDQGIATSDLTPYLKRIGAVESKPTYFVPLRGVQ